MVAEAVRAALGSRGFDTGCVRWPGATTLRRRTARLGYDAGLLLSDLDRTPRVRAAMLVAQRWQTRWVVLTGAPRGPLWGAVLEAGAALVLPTETPLDQIVATLRTIGRHPRVAECQGRDDLVAAWARMQAEHEDLAARVASLTPREREVLTLLRAGDTVAGIARILDVAPATVRSQVKAVLRKLDVNSQLAAVAAYGRLLELRQSEHAHERPVASLARPSE